MKSTVRCRLQDRTGREHTGEVVGLEVGRQQVELRVRFGPGEQIALPLGDSLQLSLFGPDLYQPHAFQGRPTRRTSPGGAETYSFRIDPARRFELELVVGGRASLRVQPKAGQPVTVELSLAGSSERFTCALQDASVSGLSVGVDWADEKRLVHAREVDVHLPGLEGEPVPIPGRIRRRTVDGETIVYGIALDPQVTPRENASVRALSAWVEARYQDLSGGARVLRRSA